MLSVVIQTSFLGDMVLTTPLLERLATDGPVDVVATPAAAGLLANHPSVRETIVYDKRGVQRGLRGFVSLAGRLQRGGYDRALLAQGSSRSGALAYFARIPSRVGFATSAGRRFYTERVPYIENAHHAERLLALSEPAKVESFVGSQPRPRLYPGERERSEVSALLEANGVGAGEQLVGVAPGSVWATKRWPGYAALVRSLPVQARVVVIGGPADRPLAEEIAAASDHAVVDATGQLSLLASAELIGRCAVLVTNDSAPLHLASAMDCPSIAVFGPTVPAFGFGPLSAGSRTMGVDSLACRPCDRHGPQRCPLQHWRCMREISADQVAAAVRALLSD